MQSQGKKEKTQRIKHKKSFSYLKAENLDESKFLSKSFDSFLSLLKKGRESEAYSLYKQMNKREKRRWIKEASKFISSRYYYKYLPSKLSEEDSKIISFIVKIVMERNDEILSSNPKGIKSENERLLIASASKDTASFLKALYNGAYINSRDVDGESFLHKSAWNNTVNILQFAFDYLRDRTDWNARDKNGITALHRAAFFSRGVVVFFMDVIKIFPLVNPLPSTLAKEKMIRNLLKGYEQQWMKVLNEKDLRSMKKSMEKYGFTMSISYQRLLLYFSSMCDEKIIDLLKEI